MNRPYVIINCAMTADGKIAQPSKKQLKISCDEDIVRMYKLRNASDAVLVGINTILNDDPKLTVKEKYVKNPKQPIRVVLDTHCKTPKNALVVNSSAQTIIIHSDICNKKFENNVKLIQCKTNKNDLLILKNVLETLYNQGIKTLMVEGGSTIIWNFLKEKVVDELYVYIAPIAIGGKNTPTLADGAGITDINEIISLEIIDIQRLGLGILIHYKMK